MKPIDIEAQTPADHRLLSLALVRNIYSVDHKTKFIRDNPELALFLMYVEAVSGLDIKTLLYTRLWFLVNDHVDLEQEVLTRSLTPDLVKNISSRVRHTYQNLQITDDVTDLPGWWMSALESSIRRLMPIGC